MPRTAATLRLPRVRPSLITALVTLLAAISVAGCMTRPPSPVSDRSLSREALSAPAAPSPAGASQEPEAPLPTHTVKRGETLYQIALDNGLDYRELAAWNNIENVNVIRVGRVLVLAAPGSATAQSAAVDAANGTVTTPLVTTPSVAAVGANGSASSDSAAPAIIAPSTGRNTLSYKAEPKALKLPYSAQALAQAQQSAPPVAPSAPAAAAPQSAASMTIPPAPAAPSPTAAPLPAARTDSAHVPEIDDSVEWAWPTAGKVIGGFSDTANLKGIDIAGKPGQAVLASGAGKIVYAGTGLRGYGKLIIIKHNNTFLSAYAHNREILVKEGQQVTKGQKIAEMGDTDTDQTKLHFEIRRLGKPVDPAKYLPPA